MNMPKTGDGTSSEPTSLLCLLIFLSRYPFSFGLCFGGGSGGMAHILEQHDVYIYIKGLICLINPGLRTLAALVLADRRFGGTEWILEQEEFFDNAGNLVLAYAGRAVPSNPRLNELREIYETRFFWDELIKREMEAEHTTSWLLRPFADDIHQPGSPTWSIDSDGHFCFSHAAVSAFALFTIT